MVRCASDGVGGWWEDSRGAVRSAQLRERYHESGKALKAAERALRGCCNEEKKHLLEAELNRCIEDFAAIEEEVKAERIE